MTQGIRKLLNLPTLDDELRSQGIDPDAEMIDEPDEPDLPEPAQHMAVATPSHRSVYDDRLRAIDGTDHADAMDKVHKETLKHASDIMDLGWNIDHARAARMFEVAAAMYGRAIEAKTHKRDAQLKAVKLALEQRKIDLAERQLRHDIGNEVPDEGSATVVVEDRNELIRQMRLSLRGDGSIR